MSDDIFSTGYEVKEGENMTSENGQTVIDTREKYMLKPVNRWLIS